MLTGEFEQIDPNTIVVDRANRQRKTLEDIDDLARSITRVGLIHPPVIDRDTLLLRTGERRLTAVLQLGWTQMPVQYSDQLTDHEAQILELEENISRVDIDWHDQALAIHYYHNLLADQGGGSMSATGEQLGFSESKISRWLIVAEELIAGNQLVQSADKLSVAIGLAERSRERKQDVELEAIDVLKSTTPIAIEATTASSSDTLKIPVLEPVTNIPLLNTDFLTWAKDYSGPKFNFIHCDFPYGVGADTRKQGNVTTKIHGTYADSEDVYWELLNCFINNADKFISKKAHILFWFSMDYYSKTVAAFLDNNWVVNPFPVVWYKTDNAGLLPDPKRGPRRIYETALLITRYMKLHY